MTEILLILLNTINQTKPNNFESFLLISKESDQYKLVECVALMDSVLTGLSFYTFIFVFQFSTYEKYWCLTDR